MRKSFVISSQEVDLAYLSKVTHGFSGADLTEVCQRVGSVSICYINCQYRGNISLNMFEFKPYLVVLE